MTQNSSLGDSPIHDPAPSHIDSIPQFFVALVNNSSQQFHLVSFTAANSCGWVREPTLNEAISPNEERIWCGMPWDLDSVIELHLTLQSHHADRLTIEFKRQHPHAASGRVVLGSDSALNATAELQREDTSSPFLTVTLRDANTR